VDSVVSRSALAVTFVLSESGLVRMERRRVGRDRDRHQFLCFAIALWNGKDPILKDSTPTHSYMKYLYKYPQAAVLYAGLIDGNRPLRCCW